MKSKLIRVLAWAVLPLVAVCLFYMPLARAHFPPPTVPIDSVYDWYTGDGTNILATNVVYNYTNFCLAVVAKFTNACAGTLDIAYTSGCGWGLENTGAQSPPISGWFSIPLTNSTTSTTVTWCTNITLRGLAWWAIPRMTNNSGQHLTNLQVRFFHRDLWNR